MAEQQQGGLGEPPAVAALSIADTVTTKPTKAKEQEITPWEVNAATDDQGNVKAFDYVEISKCALAHASPNAY
jgi:tryptophanyl-tRNA synthetase